MMMRRKLGDSALVRRVVSHHVVVGGLMGWYLFAAVRGKAKGVFFVASYMVGFAARRPVRLRHCYPQNLP